MAVYPAGTFPTPNRVVLIGRGRFEEAVVGATKFYPGNLVMDDGTGNGTYIPHNTQGGWAELLFAVEQGLQGIGGSTVPIGAFDAYQPTTQANYYVAAKGDVLNVTLASGSNAVEGGLLMSDGTGNLMVMPSSANLGGNLYEITADSASLPNYGINAFSNGTYTVPAGFLQAGDILSIKMAGRIPAVSGADDFSAILSFAGTTLVTTTAYNPSTSDQFEINCDIVIRTVGSSGTFIANGNYNIGTAGTSTTRDFIVLSTSINTTNAQNLLAEGQWILLTTSTTTSTTPAAGSDSAILTEFNVNLIRQSGGFKALAVCQTALNNTAGTGSTYSYSPAALCIVRVL